MILNQRIIWYVISYEWSLFLSWGFIILSYLIYCCYRVTEASSITQAFKIQYLRNLSISIEIIRLKINFHNGLDISMCGSHLDIWYQFLIAFNKIRDWWFYICAGLEEFIESVISHSCILYSAIAENTHNPIQHYTRHNMLC